MSIRSAAISITCWTCCLWGVVSCAEPAGQEGAACFASSECATGLCYVNICLIPDKDNDGDGLSNAREHQLASHPLSKDTDGDGKPDGAEAGTDPTSPANRDADNLVDILESSVIDSDGDCIADEADAYNAVPQDDPLILAGLGCARLGVCAEDGNSVTATCKGGVLRCDYHAVAGFLAGEACDAKDNDCDGQTDEGFAYSGHAIGEPCTGVGMCGAGIVECRGDHADCSSNPGGSAAKAMVELCNGLDDDCDGRTDQGFAHNGLPIGSPCMGRGQCGVGAVECAKTGSAMCSTDPGGSHSQVMAELCNGLDDDCDGVTDNGVLWQGIALGAACTEDGICGTGTVVCAAGGGAACSVAPGMPGSPAHAESCNGLDDNCNGVTDEGFELGGLALGAGCPAVGQCGPGIVMCSAGGGAVCSTHTPAPFGDAEPESCDGLDNDCDGQTDEQLSWQGTALGGACDGTGACGPGVVVCGVGGQTTCSTNPGAAQSQAKPESCNAQDDDCDGQTDNDVAGAPTLTCPLAGVCAANPPTPVCASGAWQCTSADPLFQEVESLCDGLDNDCDGQTDEQLPLAWGEPVKVATGRPAARREPAVASEPGKLYVIGGIVESVTAADAPVLSGEVWRLDVASVQWKLVLESAQVARRLAGAVLLPPPLGSAADHPGVLLIAGGLNAAKALAPPLQVDLLTGTVEQPAWKNQPAHRFAPVLLRWTTGHVWLLGGTADGSGATAQCLDPATGLWTANIPQPPPALGLVSACATANNDIYVHGVGASGPYFATFSPGATAWTALPATLADEAWPGRLLCDVDADEVWLLGAGTAGGEAQPARKFSKSAKTWATLDAGGGGANPPGAASWPTGLGAAVASFQGLLLATLGSSASGPALSNTFVGLPGQWTAVETAPEPVVGATSWATPEGVIRIGGAALHVGLHVLQDGAWRLQSGQWSAWPGAVGTGRAFGSVLPTPDGTALLVWGGFQVPQDGNDWLAAAVTNPPALGAEKLNLTTGAWSSPSPAEVQALPVVNADAVTAPGPAAGQWFVVGAQPGTTSPQLWLVDLVKLQKNLIWQGVDWTDGPGWQPGSALSWDPAGKRLLYAVPGPMSTLWTYTLGKPVPWSQASSNLGVSGRLHFLGRPGDPTRTLLALQPKGPASARTVTLELPLTVSAATVPKLAVSGLPVIAQSDGVAWLGGTTSDNGAQRSVWWNWFQACPP